MPKQKYQFKIPTHKHYLADGTRIRGKTPFVPTEAELKAFHNDLEVVAADVDTPEEAPASNDGGGFDVTGSKIDDVVAAVTAGRITAEEALAIEQANKNRSTLIEALEAMIG